MRRIALCLFWLGCGGSSGPAQLSVGGTYATTVTLLAGSTCSSPQVQSNPTVVAHSPGATSLSLTHAGVTYAGTIDMAGAFSVPATPVSNGAYQISITGQFNATGFTATVHVAQQQPACQYDVSWVGSKQGPPNPYP
jgi:hypothetical protein